MKSINRRFKRTVLAYVSVTICIVLALLLGGWGIYLDFSVVRESLLEAEILRVKSHAIRTVSRIEHEFHVHPSSPDFENIVNNKKYRSVWASSPEGDDENHFSAILDPLGVVIAHTDSRLKARRLERDWYIQIEKHADSNVFLTESKTLSNGQIVYCIREPIVNEGEVVGEYYSGFPVSWFEETLGQERRQMMGHWAFLLAGIFGITILTAVSLFYIATHSYGFLQALRLVKLERSVEIQKLTGGLAHEIRNPLHAIRINIHSLLEVITGRANLEREELETIIEQTNQEILRLDVLVQQMLEYARPNEPQPKPVNIIDEVRSTLRFLQQDLRRNEIEVHATFPDENVLMHIDPDRFRQIMLNLMINARDELNGGGNIELSVRRHGKWIEISIADDGSGISDEDHEKIFEPFYSTKEKGSGLGLALVKHFVEEMGGNIQCENNGNSGTIFRLNIPISK